jgi:hypothetical protein
MHTEDYKYRPRQALLEPARWTATKGTGFPHDSSDTALAEGMYLCLQLRDGSHYAKIKVTQIEPDRIAFVWIYQPSGSRNFK